MARTYPRRAASVPRARRSVRDHLLRSRVPGDVCDAAVLVVSELVTNSVLRAAGPVVRCTTRVLARGVRVEVSDAGAAEPGAGGGMLLVDRIARAWGVVPAPTGGGRTVWASLPFVRPAGRQDAANAPGADGSHRPGTGTPLRAGTA